MSNIGIVIPAYHEEKNIIKLIKHIRKYTNSYIVIVDDSENDKTEVIIKNNKLKNLYYYRRKKKLGRGSAVIYGFKKLFRKKNIKYFIEMDSDFSHKPSELNRNLKKLINENLDLLIGSRYLVKSKILNWPINRIIFSSLANILLEFLFRLDIKDYTNGYRFYSKKGLKILINKKNFISKEFLILSEILLIFKQEKLKIKEIDSIFVNRIRGESSVNISLIINSFLSMFKLFWKYKLWSN